MPETQVREYRDADEYRRDRADVEAIGWVFVAGQERADGTLKVTYRRNEGVGKGLAWGGPPRMPSPTSPRSGIGYVGDHTVLSVVIAVVLLALASLAVNAILTQPAREGTVAFVTAPPDPTSEAHPAQVTDEPIPTPGLPRTHSPTPTPTARPPRGPATVLTMKGGASPQGVANSKQILLDPGDYVLSWEARGPFPDPDVCGVNIWLFDRAGDYAGGNPGVMRMVGQPASGETTYEGLPGGLYEVQAYVGCPWSVTLTRP